MVLPILGALGTAVVPAYNYDSVGNYGASSVDTNTCARSHPAGLGRR